MPVSKRFKVALSFAGPKRPFVSQVAEILAERFGKAAVLYDQFHEAEFARADLGFHLPNLYHQESELIIVVLCADYETKEWCGLEWRAIHALLAQRRDDDVMLSRFDFATAPGLYNTAGFIELDQKSAEDFAALISTRLDLNAKSAARRIEEASPPTVLAGLPASSTFEQLDALRAQATELKLVEHVADARTARLEQYPTLVHVTLRPAGERGGFEEHAFSKMSLFRGHSLDLVFKDAVHGIAFYYQQGLYPCNFNLYLKGRSAHEVYPGRGYIPKVMFFGFASSNEIERVIVQPQAEGNVQLVGVHVFSARSHNLVAGDKSNPPTSDST